MARGIPFRIPGVCIDCAGEINRHPATYRCMPCHDAVAAFRAAAQQAIKSAIKAGHMKPASEFFCVDCEAPACDYDHRDYSRQLDVVPVCRPCNQRRGPARWDRPELVTHD